MVTQPDDFAMLDLPESLPERVSWLEDRLVSADFGTFLSQLEVVVTAGAKLPQRVQPRQPIEQVLGENREIFHSSGLSSITDEQFFHLLLSPKALIALNEEVFVRGGQYWQNKIERILDSARSANKANEGPELKPTPSGNTSPSASFSLTPILGIAASILLVLGGIWILGGFGGGNGGQQVAQGWGWERDDWFADAKTPVQYMDRMIEGANAWSAKPVKTKDEYIRRLSQLMAGCQKMIDAEHPLLTAPQRELLVSKCQKWKVKFEAQLEEAKSSPADFLQTKSKTDATIDAAIVALKTILDA